MAVHEWEDLLYIEHFAVAPAYRNAGLGRKMLQALLSGTKKRVCLEVEPPQDELTRRRIAFYERNGFLYHEYPYTQPSISAGRSPIPLRIMATQPLSEEAFCEVRERLYREVYGARK